MGYLYTNGGALICDGCGHSIGVRKVPCPHGYCSPAALCSACRKVDKVKHPKRHEGCKAASEEWDQREQARAAALASGASVRVAALNAKERGIHVLFDNAKGITEGYYMPEEVYRAFPLLAVTTPNDYRQHGELLPAPSSFY